MNSRTAGKTPFNIIVCVKQVPAGAQAKLDPVTKTLVRSAGASILNPYDAFAVEAALQIRDDLTARNEAQASDAPAAECSVTALSMGVPSAEKMLKDLIARGVDEGVLLTDRAFAGADTIATSRSLSLGVREIGYRSGNPSLIICGHMAVFNEYFDTSSSGYSSWSKCMPTQRLGSVKIWISQGT